MVELVGWPRRRSSVVMSRDERLWENVSCRRKKVRNAGSEGRSARVLVVLGGDDVAEGTREFRLSPLGKALGAERQICASIPSIWRRPLRIFERSVEDMLSKARERRVSIARLVCRRTARIMNGNK